MIIKEGNSSYGYCWIESRGAFFYVFTMDGKSQSGPYTTLADAMREFSRYCA